MNGFMLGYVLKNARLGCLGFVGRSRVVDCEQAGALLYPRLATLLAGVLVRPLVGELFR